MNDDSKTNVLMTPGPVRVPDAVLEELAKPIIFHRYEDFQALYGRLVARLHRLFGGTPDHKCLMFTGSGTLANETVLGSVFDEKDKVLVISNGDFGERLATICSLHNIPTIHHKLSYFEVVDPEEVVNIAFSGGVTGIALVAMETSTGMINPVRDIGFLLKKRSNSRITFFVDAVSAFGCESLDVGDWAVSYCTSVPNKALEAPPGVSFACVDINLYMSRERLPRNYYLDLSRYIKFNACLQTPTTPSIPQFRAMQKALDLLEEEGIVNRRARYLSMSRRLIERLEPLGFHPVIKSQAQRSPAVTAFEVPKGVDADQLNMALRKNGYILWFPQQYLYRGVTRLMLASVMGCIYECHIDSLADIIRSFIE
jgi:2-aminoethylphosphonate-pyruvate transaminase